MELTALLSLLLQVVTTVDTMTVPLSEVFFPSVVVCNINQASKPANSRNLAFPSKCEIY